MFVLCLFYVILKIPGQSYYNIYVSDEQKASASNGQLHEHDLRLILFQNGGSTTDRYFITIILYLYGVLSANFTG